MTLKQYLIAGVIEQAIVLGVILPATGWWFAALTAVWNLLLMALISNYVFFKRIDLGEI